MKTRNKALLLTLCAVVLVAASVLGTMAYLTSTTNDVVNTFTVGNVTISLDEAKVTPDGKVVTGGGRVLKNEYKLMPGHTYYKDPTVHVEKSSEDCYVRMFVEIAEYQTLLDKLGADTLPESFATWNSEYWTCVDYRMKGNNAVLEFRHNDIVTVTDKTKDLDLPALFTEIKLPETITDMQGLDKVVITVSAEAIQADGFDTAAEAFAKLPVRA